MNKTSFIITILAILLSACSKKESECRIHGTVNNPKLEGACIFLIAEDARIRDSVGIDSTFIKNGKFELTTNKNMMGILRLDYHYRYGIQDLLVVEEPGDIYVSIDSISSGSGTENNEKLQQWKDITILYKTKVSGIMRSRYIATQKKDSVSVQRYDHLTDSLYGDFMNQTTAISNGLKDGPLKEFFYKMFRIGSNSSTNK